MELGIVGVSGAVEVGRGGTAVVYRAEQTALRRVVAIKMLQIGHDEAARRRFDRERRLLARLEHPNIAVVYDSGYTASGDPYLILPFLENSLHSQLPLAPARAVEVMIQVGDAMAYAHGLGILHRDLKPKNIMLDGDRPVVVDFGLARLDEAVGTQSVALNLTPAYAAPEAFEQHELSPSLDVYGLGATLHALVAGQDPFTEDDPGFWAVVTRVKSQPPADLRHLAHQALCVTIEQAMAKDPAGRYASAAAFVTALRSLPPASPVDHAARPDQFVSGPTVADVSAAPTPALSELTPDRRRRAQLMMVIGAAIVFIAALLIIQRISRATPTIVAVPTVTAATSTAGLAVDPPDATPEPAAATPEPSAEPDALDPIRTGIEAASQYIGVGTAPAQEQTCPGLIGFCLGDDIADIETALGSRSVQDSGIGESRSWVLPGGATIGAISTGDRITSMSASSLPGTQISLFGLPPIGLVTVGQAQQEYGPNDWIQELDDYSVTHCVDPAQDIQALVRIFASADLSDRFPDLRERDIPTLLADEPVSEYEVIDGASERRRVSPC